MSHCGGLPHIRGYTWDHAQNWANAIRTRLVGSAGQFHPRVSLPWQSFGSLYDLQPLRSRLEGLIDFGRLNSGETRVTVATTDIESGELVLFDTAKGDRIGIDHLMASCGFLPEFAPVEIDGRMLGDGGLAANAPIEALWQDDSKDDLTCFVLDLYARDGNRPAGLESALARKNDLIFSNQTWQRLAAFGREQELRIQLAGGDKQNRRSVVMLYLSYRPLPEEAGPERGFDYSGRMLERRWEAGALDMDAAIATLEHGTAGKAGVVIKAIRRTQAAPEVAVHQQQAAS
jgi:NTE family protein